MDTLESLVSSGHIVDLMLAFVVVEVALVALYRRRTGGGIATRSMLVNVGAGGSLMVALRLCATGAQWHWVAVALVSALAFHVADLAQRWARAPAAAPTLATSRGQSA